MPKAKQPKDSEIKEVAIEEVAPPVSPEPEVKDKPKSKTSEVKAMNKTFTIIHS